MRELQRQAWPFGLAGIFSSRFANLFRARARSRRQFGHPGRGRLRLEALEERLLLSADLVGVPSLEGDGETLRPGDRIEAAVLVRNIGDTAKRGAVEIQLYASLDAILDPSDLLLDTAVHRGRLAPGGAQALEFELDLPAALQPGEYSLISVVDSGGDLAENSEANNIAVGESFSVAWTFGDAPLTVRDEDGTFVTFSLSGAGTGEISIVDGEWDVLVSGTNGSSVLSVLGFGGDQRVTLDDIAVEGPLGALLAPTMDLTGTLAVDGPLSGGLIIGGASGAVIAAPTIAGSGFFGLGGIAILGDLEDSEIRIGEDLGDLLIGGSMISSAVHVEGSVDSVTILDGMSADSRIIAADLPKLAFIDGHLVRTASDPRFIDGPRGASFSFAFLASTGSIGEAGGSASLTVVLTTDAALTGDVTVDLSALGTGGATAGADYVFAGPATLRFAAGSVSGATQSASVIVADDLAVESAPEAADFSFGNVQVAGDDVYVGAPTGSHRLSIVDDDTAGERSYGAAAPGEYRIARAGSEIRIFQGSMLVASALPGDFALTFNGAAGGTTLAIDFSGGNPIPSGGITFNGGAGNDTLVLEGGGASGLFDTITHTFDSETSGAIELDPDGPEGAAASLVAYTGLEPIVDNLDAANRTFTFNAGPETITLGDAVGNLMRIDSNVGGELADFALPTRSLTINAGTGDDTIVVASVDSAFRAALTMDGQAGSDTINLHASLLLNAALATGDLAFAAETINLNAPSIATTGGQSYTGAVTLGGVGVRALSAADGGIVFNGSLALTPGAAAISAREIDFNGGVNSVSGPAALALEPESGSTPVVVGGASDTGPGSLDITDTDIAALSNGLGVTIGRSAGTHAITVDASGASFKASLAMRGGTITVSGALESSQALSLNAVGTVAIHGQIDTQRGDVDIRAAGAMTLDAAIDTLGGRVGIDAASVTAGVQGSITTTGSNAFQNSGSVSISGRTGVSLAADIVSRGFEGASGAGDGGGVSISTSDGAVSVAGIDTRGGSSALSGLGRNGGSITLSAGDAAGGADGHATTVNGSLLAQGGSGQGGGRGFGGVIQINAFSFFPLDDAGTGLTTITGAVITNLATIGIEGEGITVGGAIATSGFAEVSLDGKGGAVLLGDTVTGGSDEIQIFGLAGVTFNGALSTRGGDIDITTSGAITGGTGATITTTGSQSFQRSGFVSISGRTGVNLAADIVTRGFEDASVAADGGGVSISTNDGAVSVAGIDTRGGASAGSGRSGGSITLRAGDAQGGASGHATTVNGSLLAQAGLPGPGSFGGFGGVIMINAFPFDNAGTGLTTITGAVMTDRAPIDIEGEGITVGGAIATSDFARVSLDGKGGAVHLEGAVTGGAEEMEIFGLAGVTFNGALGTRGGDIGITTSGAITGGTGATITTTGSQSFQRSGLVSISGRTGVNLAADIVTRGFEDASGAADGGGVSISTNDGAVSVAGIDTRGGASAGSGRSGGSITLRAGDAQGGASGHATTVNGSLLAQAGLPGPGSFGGFGGAIMINAFPFDNAGTGLTTITGAVITSHTTIDIQGEGIMVGGAIAASDFAEVSLDGKGGAVLLQGAVTGGGRGIDISGAAGVTFNGLLSAGGDVEVTTGGAVSVDGVLDVGANAISFIAPGGVVFSAGTVLRVELSGAGQFTTVTISDGVTLDGTLEATLAGGLALTPGDRFRFMSYGERDGSFGATLLPADFTVEEFDASALELVFAPNDAPVLAPIGNRTADEHALLRFTALATDPDPAVDGMTFSLDAGAPAGAAIDPLSGEFTWTPDEAQGPGTYSVTVRVTDDGAPGRDDFETITITVNEVNARPVLAPVGDRTVEEGALLTFTALATDDDLPPNTLTFTLDAGAPAGAVIDPVTGVFSWTPGSAQGPASLPITIRVTDNGGLDDFETITVDVTEPAVTTARWINAAGGDWNIASNWDIGRVPGAGDEVIIDISVATPVTRSGALVIDSLTLSAGAVQFNDAATMATLTQSGGTLGGAGAVTLTGSSEWEGGTIAGRVLVTGELAASTATGDLTLSGELTIGDGSASASFALSGAAGTLFMNDAAFDPGQIIVRSLAAMSLDGDTEITATGGQSGTMYVSIESGAALHKTGAAMSDVNSVTLLNSGLVEVEAGRLRLTGGGSHTHNGQFEVAAGATLDLNVNTHEFSGNSAVLGAGNLEGNGFIDQVGAGSTTLIETSYVNTTLRVSQGTMEFTGTVTNGGQMLVDSGATLIISGDLANYDAATQTLGPVLANNFAAFSVAGTLSVADADIVTNRAEITLIGPASQFLNHATGADALAGLAANPGRFILTEGRSFATAGEFTSSGLLSVGAGSTFTAANRFVNDVGQVTVEIAGAADFGRIAVAGTPGEALIDFGVLQVDFADGFVPAVGDRFQFMTFASRTGYFFFEFAPPGTVVDQSDATDLELVVQAVVTDSVRWINPAGGLWDDPDNWSTGALPQPDEAVFIDLAGSYTVEFASGSAVVHSLTTDRELVLSGGSLTVENALDIDVNTFLVLDGGTLAHADVSGSIVVPGGGTGTLDAVALVSGTSAPDAGFVLVESGATLTVLNGMTVDGGIEVQGTGVVTAAGSQTWRGTGGSVALIDAGSSLSAGLGDVLTLEGNSLTVSGSGTLGSSGSQVVNRARIVGMQGGGTLTVHNLVNDNDGNVENLGNIAIIGDLVNSGQVTLGSGDVITVDGSFTNTALGTVMLSQTSFGKVGTLSVLGDATLDGSLVIDGGLPQHGFTLGDRYLFMTFNSLTGYFASTSLINFPADQSAEVDLSDPNALELVVVAPAAPLMLALAEAPADAPASDPAFGWKRLDKLAARTMDQPSAAKRTAVDWNARADAKFGSPAPYALKPPYAANLAKFLRSS